MQKFTIINESAMFSKRCKDTDKSSFKKRGRLKKATLLSDDSPEEISKTNAIEVSNMFCGSQELDSTEAACQSAKVISTTVSPLKKRGRPKKVTMEEVIDVDTDVYMKNNKTAKVHDGIQSVANNASSEEESYELIDTTTERNYLSANMIENSVNNSTHRPVRLRKSRVFEDFYQFDKPDRSKMSSRRQCKSLPLEDSIIVESPSFFSSPDSRLDVSSDNPHEPTITPVVRKRGRPKKSNSSMFTPTQCSSVDDTEDESVCLADDEKVKGVSQLDPHVSNESLLAPKKMGTYKISTPISESYLGTISFETVAQIANIAKLKQCDNLISGEMHESVDKSNLPRRNGFGNSVNEIGQPEKGTKTVSVTSKKSMSKKKERPKRMSRACNVDSAEKEDLAQKQMLAILNENVSSNHKSISQSNDMAGSGEVKKRRSKNIFDKNEPDSLVDSKTYINSVVRKKGRPRNSINSNNSKVNNTVNEQLKVKSTISLDSSSLSDIVNLESHEAVIGDRFEGLRTDVINEQKKSVVSVKGHRGQQRSRKNNPYITKRINDSGSETDEYYEDTLVNLKLEKGRNLQILQTSPEKDRGSRRSMSTRSTFCGSRQRQVKRKCDSYSSDSSDSVPLHKSKRKCQNIRNSTSGVVRGSNKVKDISQSQGKRNIAKQASDDDLDIDDVMVADNKMKTYVCKHCVFSTGSDKAMKHHMMTLHSLWWTRTNPEGIEDPISIFKVLKYIDCPKPECRKRFKFVHYYKFHKIWCGRENELAECPYCKRPYKAMWLHSHIVSLHKETEEGKTKEEKANGVSEDDAVGGQRKKRRAAKSANKLIKQVQNVRSEDDEQIVADDKDEEYKDNMKDEESDADDGDDDDDDEDTYDENEEPDNDSDEEKMASLNLRYMKSPSWNMYQFNEDTWTPNKRLHVVLEHYRRAETGDPAHTSLRPYRDQWLPLSHTDRQTYIQANIKPVQVTESGGGDSMSIPWGQSMAFTDRTYSNVGGPVWAIEWCPFPAGSSSCQVAAVSADLTGETSPHIASPISKPGLVQLWVFSGLELSGQIKPTPQLHLCLAHQIGYVRSLAWCPHRCFDLESHGNKSDYPDKSESIESSSCFPRLGLLAVAGSSGTVEIYSIPKIDSLPKCQETPPIFKPTPCLCLIPPRPSGQCTSVSWRPSGSLNYILAGYGCGVSYIWDITNCSPLLKVDGNHLLPIKTFQDGGMGVLDVAWSCRNPNVFVTSSMDMCLAVWDLRKPQQPIMMSKKTVDHQYIRSVSSLGPARCGYLTAGDKPVDQEACPLSIGGFSPSYLRLSAMKTPIAKHIGSLWDSSFCPFYEICVSSDNCGCVRVVLPPLTSYLARSKLSHSMFKSKVLAKMVYKVGVQKADTLRISESVKGSAQKNKKVSKNSRKDELMTGLEESRSSGISKTVIPNLQPDVESVTLEDSPIDTEHKTPMRCEFHYENFPDRELVPVDKWKKSCKTWLDSQCRVDVEEDSLTGVYRIRVNPNSSSCLWMLSGGQSGLLRLDNLFSAVSPHASQITQALRSAHKSTV